MQNTRGVTGVANVLPELGEEVTQLASALLRGILQKVPVCVLGRG